MLEKRTFQGTFRFADAGTLAPPGPVGRLVRGLLGILCLWLVVQLVTRTDMADLYNPTIWLYLILGLALVPYVTNIGFGVDLGGWPRIISLALLGSGAMVSYAATGTVSTSVFWVVVVIWMVYVYGHLGISFVLAALLGTPGCEMRAIPHLVGLISKKNAQEHYCPGFIRRIDEWETARRKNIDDEMIPRVQFLSFEGCPLADTARASLESAMTDCGLNSRQYESIDIFDERTPKQLKAWGSPTILVDGKDVTGNPQGDAAGCRIYETRDGVPSVDTISEALRAAVCR